jgi:hypothetical protein
MPGETELRLYRDSLSTPWGFRLYGGKDLSIPLSVQRVLTGTPSDGELQSGDLILQIQGSDAGRLTHLQAQEQIRKAGGSLLLRIVRYGAPIRAPRSVAQGPEQKAAPWRKPTAPDLGIDYARGQQQKLPLPIQTQQPPQPGFMLSRVKDTLSGVSPGPGGTYYGDPYYFTPTYTTPTYTTPTYQQRDLTPTRLNVAPAYQPAHVEPEQPAWAGSLRSSGQPLDSDKYVGPVPHNPKVQTVHYGAGGEAPQYRQRSAQDAPHDTDTVRAAHLQYNSPLGLYSKSSAQEALVTQLHGKPGEGTIQILSESDVSPSGGGGGGGGGGQKGPPSAVAAALHPGPESSTQAVVQSPSLLLLESQLGAGGGGDDIGQSDF